jgi:signal transduction histidine kinase
VAASSSPGDAVDMALRAISYEVLRSYPDVEGGYFLGGQVIGHSFPTYTEPGSGLKQPAIERNAVLTCLAESRNSGQVARQVFTDGKDLVVVSALVTQGRPLATWGLKRYINFNASGNWIHQLLLGGLMLISLICIGAVLKLSFGLQRGFAAIQAGLARLRTDLDYRLPDQHHELRAIVAAINEMAASRQKLEADLRREDRLRVIGRVVAGIAHEIRNPLNSIRLTIKVLERRLRKHNIGEEEIALVMAETDRLDKLLNSILVFRADEPGRLQHQPIRPILERTMALVKPQIEDRGIVTGLSAPPGVQATVDGDHLQQAMMNLLLNAIDAAGSGGRIHVSMQQNNGHIEIDVEDSGPGLNREQQERLFEAFYTTKDSGTGLGLAVTRTLLEKMGASIQYVASGPGAHFRILLPAGAAHES